MDYDKQARKGYFGEFGGQFVPETLMVALQELETAYAKFKDDPKFLDELDYYLSNYAGRPTPLYYAERLSEKYGGAKIYLKREDLTHTGSHKINNALGQILLAKRMNKIRVIAETGAGQHGVATATAAAMAGLECDVFMGEEDIKRQSLNVFKMKLLGARVCPVSSGTKTLKDATNEALRDWVANVEHTHYIIGSVVGPHPYPMMVRDFQRVIGMEAKAQILSAEGCFPDTIIACVGGGSNSIGIFYDFIDSGVELIGVEAAGRGIETGEHGASLGQGTKGILHGSLSYILQDEYGQIMPAHSISAGLDYPGTGPEHAYLKDSGKAKYIAITDEEALDAFKDLSEIEGIIPALESSHALSYAKIIAAQNAGKVFIVNLSGRGDKDVQVVAEAMGVEL